MAGRASKNKGKTGERELCAIFGEYFEGNFERVPWSGAFIGGKNIVRKETMTEAQIRAAKSDIIPPDDMPKLVLECKWYKDFPFHAFAYGNDIPILDGWINDLEYDCDEQDLGLLCIKVNRKGWFVAYNANYSDFNDGTHIFYKGYRITDLHRFLERNKDFIKTLSA